MRRFGRTPQFWLGAGMGRTTQFADAIGSDHFVLVREGGRGGTRRHIELRQNVADMTIDGLDAQEQVARDGGVGAPARDQPQHFDLAASEPESRL